VVDRSIDRPAARKAAPVWSFGSNRSHGWMWHRTLCGTGSIRFTGPRRWLGRELPVCPPDFGCRRSGARGGQWFGRIPAGRCCWVRSNAVVERSPRRQAGPLERTGRGVLCRYAWSGNGKAERACATRTALEREGGGIVAPRRPNAERELVLATPLIVLSQGGIRSRLDAFRG
jgi:hypothetical protein